MAVRRCPSAFLAPLLLAAAAFLPVLAGDEEAVTPPGTTFGGSVMVTALSVHQPYFGCPGAQPEGSAGRTGYNWLEAAARV